MDSTYTLLDNGKIIVAIDHQDASAQAEIDSLKEQHFRVVLNAMPAHCKEEAIRLWRREKAKRKLKPIPWYIRLVTALLIFPGGVLLTLGSLEMGRVDEAAIMLVVVLILLAGAFRFPWTYFFGLGWVLYVNVIFFLARGAGYIDALYYCLWAMLAGTVLLGYFVIDRMIHKRRFLAI